MTSILCALIFIFFCVGSCLLFLAILSMHDSQEEEAICDEMIENYFERIKSEKDSW